MKFKIITIKDPEDFICPLDKKTHENPNIVYHGTSSLFIDKIEKDGWSNDTDKPYDIKDIKLIHRIFDSIMYMGEINHGYVNIASYTLKNYDSKTQKKFGFFSQKYTIAGNYARNKGGETIHNTILAVEDFLFFVKKPELQIKNKEKLKIKLTKYPPAVSYHKKILEALNLLDNKKYLNDMAEKLQKIKNKYEKLVKNHYPVVYALKIKPNWFKNWANPDKMINSGEVNLVAIKSIKPENIIARIVFPNGVERFD